MSPGYRTLYHHHPLLSLKPVFHLLTEFSNSLWTTLIAIVLEGYLYIVDKSLVCHNKARNLFPVLYISEVLRKGHYGATSDKYYIQGMQVLFCIVWIVAFR